jgi:hypothetical protein
MPGSIGIRARAMARRGSTQKPYGNSYVERDIAEILEAPASDWEWEDGERTDIPTREAH